MNSQFKIITSMDYGAPILGGTSGSLINVLNFALVSGSGWLQPSASVKYSGAVDTLAIYQQPSGSKCVLFVNDAAPHAVALGREAWVTGWETVTSMTSSNTTASIGVGYGQFPYVGQTPLTLTNLNNGHFTVVKSITADTTVLRPWFIFVDDRTFYLFIRDGNVLAGATYVYQSLFFGDIFSLQGPGDTEKCMIQGRILDNSPVSVLNDQNDVISFFLQNNSSDGASGVINRTSDGRYLSNWISKLGDIGKSTNTDPYTGGGQNWFPMKGVIPCPNGADDSIYLAPIFIAEMFGGTSGASLRGRMRGMYQVCHPISQFPDGLTFYGAGEQFGKRFQIVSQGWNAGYWCIETSNTVETN